MKKMLFIVLIIILFIPISAYSQDDEFYFEGFNGGLGAMNSIRLTEKYLISFGGVINLGYNFKYFGLHVEYVISYNNNPFYTDTSIDYFEGIYHSARLMLPIKPDDPSIIFEGGLEEGFIGTYEPFVGFSYNIMKDGANDLVNFMRVMEIGVRKSILTREFAIFSSVIFSIVLHQRELWLPQLFLSFEIGFQLRMYNKD